MKCSMYSCYSWQKIYIPSLTIGCFKVPLLFYSIGFPPSSYIEITDRIQPQRLFPHTCLMILQLLQPIRTPSSFIPFSLAIVFDSLQVEFVIMYLMRNKDVI